MKVACLALSKTCILVIAVSAIACRLSVSASWTRHTSDLEQEETTTSYDFESTFETNWPGYELPPWANKHVNHYVPPEEEVCFVHVGKAGGSAVGCMLGFSLHCNDTTAQQAGGVLPEVTTHIFHKDVYDCRDDSAYFLFVVRDPIDRARSAFNYDRPDDDDDDDDDDDEMASFYLECPFFRFEDYVQNGLTEHGEASGECKDTARDALAGTLRDYYRGPSHFYYNYQYYHEAVPADARILVIRNEHMKEDWDGLEILLLGATTVDKGRGGVGSSDHRDDVVSFPRNNVNTWSDEDDLYLSNESMATLCRALCNEIQQYKMILRRAENLEDVELRTSLLELDARCPEQAVADECSEPLPDIDEKLREDRGYGPEEQAS